MRLSATKTSSLLVSVSSLLGGRLDKNASQIITILLVT
ncbi:hypothetical protein PRUB_a0629 [Pseudoalteromonas rubra]|uniref:Uncharacterized protein n=1 Tax=Pseudoalteromonas rubra TaxID=43658 RepID=A0A8T0C6B4_9GAMM|nr:hypothetical protein PRUB_a0629 [Pseudoalteromonas rubra]